MNKYKWVVGLAIAVGVGFCWAPTAEAGIQTSPLVASGDYLGFTLNNCIYYVDQGETGGEFNVTVYNSAQTPVNGNSSFFTFCADPVTDWSSGQLYKVTSISDTNHNGLSLTPFAQWVYFEYRLGDTNSATTNPSGVGLNYNSQYVLGHNTGITAEIAGAIQQVVWVGEGYNPWGVLGYGPSPTASLDYSDAAIASLVSGWYKDYTKEMNEYDNDQSGTTSDILDYANFLSEQKYLSIAKLTDGSGDPAQNQLVLGLYLPTTNDADSVPEPTTLAIWGIGAGLVGAGAMRRRKQPRGRWSEDDRQAILQVIHRNKH